MNKLAILEGLLFIVGDDGINIKKISEIMNVNEDEVKDLINNLKKTYLNEDRGLQLEIYGDTIKIVTKKEYKEYYQKLLEVEDDGLLSQAALETLAIIAYNEPVTMIEVDEIRGINSSHLIRKLLSRNLIKELGKADVVGKPNLYGVTDSFLDYFGISSVDELPKIETIEVDENEKDLFESKYKENNN